MININQFIDYNPNYDPDKPDAGVPKTLMNWRWMKKVMKRCCDLRKSTQGERERLYNTLDRMHKLVLSKGSEENVNLFMSMASKLCKAMKKPMPELKGWLTEEEIEEYLTKV